MTIARRLLIVGDSFAGGGAERVILDLVKAARSSENLHFIVAVARAAGPLEADYHANATIYETGPYRGLHNTPKFARRLREIIELEKIDVVVSNMTTLNKAVLRARLLSRNFPPVIIVEHTEIGRQFIHVRSKLKRIMRPIEVKWLYRYAARICTVSSGIADDLQKYCGIHPDHTLTIHNPVDLSRVTETAERHVSVGALDGKVIISVGRLEKVKRYDRLIRAFAAISKARHNFNDRLFIIGEGPMRQDLINLRDELGLKDRVVMPGFSSNVMEYMRCADLFVSTSAFEGLGNAMLESIAVGCPCVAFRTSGSTENAKFVGAIKLIEQGDHSGFVSSVVEELENPRLNVSVEDKAFVDGLSPDQVLSRYVNLIDALL